MTMTDPISAASDDDSPFDHIVDDEGPRKACADWAHGEIGGGGRLPEDVAAELVAGGWSVEDAEEICEAARRQTRHLRGAATRAEVAGAFGIGDPSVMRNATGAGRRGLFAAIGGLIRAIVRLRATRRFGRPKD
jgi:hypothetical protein